VDRDNKNRRIEKSVPLCRGHGRRKKNVGWVCDVDSVGAVLDAVVSESASAVVTDNTTFSQRNQMNAENI
jgi:hypothetical protein